MQLRTKLLPIVLILFSIVLTMQSSVSAEDFYGLSKILVGRSRTNKNTTIMPTKVEVTDRGGVFQIRFPNTSGSCTADYEFRWEFPEGISKMQQNQEYPFQIVGRRIGGTCEKNTNTAWLMSASSGSALASKVGIKSPGTSIKFAAKPYGSIYAYPPGKENATGGTIQPGPIYDYSYFTFQFDFSSFPYSDQSLLSDYQVVYYYQKNHSAKYVVENH